MCSTLSRTMPNQQFTRSPKKAHPRKHAHPPFLNEVVAKGAFLSKVCPPIYVAVHAVMLSKKHHRSSTVQEEGLTNEGRHHLLLLCNHAHDKRGTAESRHAQITRAKLTACEVGVFSRYHNSRKYTHPPLLGAT